ncbi:hypothetical protein YQE_08356, partial [Dendroctonus ponderosae]
MMSVEEEAQKSAPPYSLLINSPAISQEFPTWRRQDQVQRTVEALKKTTVEAQNPLKSTSPRTGNPGVLVFGSERHQDEAIRRPARCFGAHFHFDDERQVTIGHLHSDLGWDWFQNYLEKTVYNMSPKRGACVLFHVSLPASMGSSPAAQLWPHL